MFFFTLKIIYQSGEIWKVFYFNQEEFKIVWMKLYKSHECIQLLRIWPEKNGSAIMGNWSEKNEEKVRKFIITYFRLTE